MIWKRKHPPTIFGSARMASIADSDAWCDFRIGVHKPEDVAIGNLCSGVHLFCASNRGSDDVIRIMTTQLCGSVIAPAINHNDLRRRRDLAQMAQKADDNRRFVQHRHNDRDRHGRLD